MNEQLDRIEIQLAALQGAVEETAKNVETMRTYLLWGFWATVAVIVVPLLILPLLLPAFLGSLGAGLGL